MSRRATDPGASDSPDRPRPEDRRRRSARDSGEATDQRKAEALWTAVNALRERASMARWAAERPQTSLSQTPEMLREAAERDETMAEVLRQEARQVEQPLAQVIRIVPGVRRRQ
jgi:hypothetical protein